MPLTDITIRKAKPKDKPYKVSDGRGLNILINKTGKYWRYSYRFDGKQKTLALGVYPDISLSLAREEHQKARNKLAQGIDPAAERKATKFVDKETFEAVAREWHNKFSHTWSENYAARILTRLEKDIFPWLGCKPIKKIEPPELLTIIRRVESRGALETAHRVMQTCGQVFRYGVATGRAARDPSQDLKGALPPSKEKHYASITDPVKIGELLRAIDGYKGSFLTRCTLKLAPLVFVRPGELRHSEWIEVDFDNAEWRIPGCKMKMKEKHIVPLSIQAIEILKEIKAVTGTGKYVFPSLRTKDRPMSENTVNAGLRRLGYSKEEMTGHGFRSMASTLLNEQGWNHDAIERQLAHAERDNVRAAYNYAQYLPERKNMMQAWSDYLEGLKNGGSIVTLKNNVKTR